jgi:SPP1 gp7 family putative phage head morphogenesis protein
MGRQVQRATRVAIQNLLLSRGLEALSEVSRMIMRIDRMPLLMALIETFLAGEKRARITAKQIGHVSPAVAREIDRRGEPLSLALRPGISEILNRLRTSSAMRSLQSVSNAELWNGANATTDQLVRAANKAIESGLHKDAAIKYVAAQVPSATQHIETVWRTQNSVAYNVGLWEENQKNPVLRDMLWGYEYSANGDGRTRPTHDLMDGTRAPVDHEVWRHWYPPNGYNCRCTVVPLYDDEGIYIPYPNLRPDPGFDNNIAMASRGMTVTKAEVSQLQVVSVPLHTPEPMPLVSEVDIDKLKQNLEAYVGGGFASVKQVVSPEEWEWIQQHLQEYKEPIYRVEDAQFTAANLEVGSSFVFEDDLRSFTKSKAYVNQIMSSVEDEDIYMEQPVIFKTVGSTQAFEMAPYTQAYMEDQSEVLAGGNFQVVAIKTENIGGKAYTVYEIKQEGKPAPSVPDIITEDTPTVDELVQPTAMSDFDPPSKQELKAYAKKYQEALDARDELITVLKRIQQITGSYSAPAEIIKLPSQGQPKLKFEMVFTQIGKQAEDFRKFTILNTQLLEDLQAQQADVSKVHDQVELPTPEAPISPARYAEYEKQVQQMLGIHKLISKLHSQIVALGHQPVAKKIMFGANAKLPPATAASKEFAALDAWLVSVHPVVLERYNQLKQQLEALQSPANNVSAAVITSIRILREAVESVKEWSDTLQKRWDQVYENSNPLWVPPAPWLMASPASKEEATKIIKGLQNFIEDTRARLNTIAATLDIKETPVQRKEIKQQIDRSEWEVLVGKAKKQVTSTWSKGWLDKLRPDEQEAVTMYTGNDYKLINKTLRGQELPTSARNEQSKARVEQYINNIKRALDKASTKKDIVVTRGVEDDAIASLYQIPQTELKQTGDTDPLVGAVIHERGFLSTTINPEERFEGIRLVIKVPKSARAAYVRPISQVKSEQEILIQAGANFVTEAVDRMPNGSIKTIYLTLSNEDDEGKNANGNFRSRE